MAALASVPWWMYVIGGFAFVITVGVLIVWQVIQSRWEAEEEREFAAGKGMAPITHPEPLHGWTTMVCGVVDGGASWMNESAQAGQNMLGGSWSVSNTALVDVRLSELAAQEHNAWNLVRALRIVLAAYAAQYLDPAGCWNRARPIAQELQYRYPSFEAIADDYLHGLGAWLNASSSGMAQHPELQRCRANAERLRASKWNGVDYRAPL
jgi:hypothetical protein